MAALVSFLKVSEDGALVRYRFGDDPDACTRYLTVNKESRRSSPDDGRTDYAFVKASRRISALREERGVWPDRGMSAS
ncbi:hypothetical protein [Streptomyces sp. NPDC058872]|uniref:hypothetical protein n=1 Tax=Streptomyces sp. NPDC058872 TaxID=3346661 RepID=UPI0036856993